MVEIREATPADDGELRRLEDASPQGHESRISTERTTFFYRSELFPHAHVLLALEESRAVGLMAYAVKEAYVQGELVPVAYLYDLRSDPRYRRSMKRGLWELWRAVRDQSRAKGARFIYGHVKGDNAEAMRVFSRGGAQGVGGFNVILRPSDPDGFDCTPSRTGATPSPFWRIPSGCGTFVLLAWAKPTHGERNGDTCGGSSAWRRVEASPRRACGTARTFTVSA